VYCTRFLSPLTLFPKLIYTEQKTTEILRAIINHHSIYNIIHYIICMTNNDIALLISELKQLRVREARVIEALEATLREQQQQPEPLESTNCSQQYCHCRIGTTTGTYTNR
jgi:hypothetical protein